MPIQESVVLMALAVTTAAAPAPLVGQATYYNPGIMERVYEYRLRVGDVEPCEECVGMVALLDAEHIGKKVWLTHPSGEVVGKLLVVDCAQYGHREMLLERGWVVDVSWEIATHWRMRAPLEGVTVRFDNE